MCRAVTLSRSPPRAETTMIATGERSRIWRHRSKPSASGSIKSSRTMSGSSVSSSCRARMPSTLTMVSKPRTARLDRIRSTMLGSSSTTRAQVLRVSSVIVTVVVPSVRGHPACVDRGLDRQVDLEAGALGQRGQLDPAAVGLHDSLGDGQAEAGAGALALAIAGAAVAGAAVAGVVLTVVRRRTPSGLERGGHQFGRHADAVVPHADHHLGRPV